MVVLQVPGDRVRSGVQALPGRVLAQLGDQAGRCLRDGPRGGPRPSRPRLERGLALGPVPDTSRETQRCDDTPYARATSLWDRPSATTAVMTRRAFDIPGPCRPGYSYVLRDAIPMS